MVLPKSRNAVGLGNSLMNDRFGKGKGQDMRRAPQAIRRTAPDGSTYVTTPKDEAAWVKMQSVTEQGDLDEFLSTAQLSGRDFTAEKINNVKIIHTDQKNPYLLSATEERATIKKHKANRARLRVPRRPVWDESTTPQELDEREKESFLLWRRGLAELQENNDLLMTPFERNLEIWRQLWRVIERSDLIVQIVDARNPLLFRCEDLEKYVKEVDPNKNNLLLINKADMMTIAQREAWAEYFADAGIKYAFFSAALARDLNDAQESTLSTPSESDEEVEETKETAVDGGVALNELSYPDEGEKKNAQEAEDDDDAWSSDSEASNDNSNEPSALERTRILTTEELEALFLDCSPRHLVGEDNQPRKTQIGLVGYPNVGKSSTINALIGAKKVSVSATPGKTKHFQTIHLSDAVILCDCPGLVFPNFATTKADLVCNGVLPIDQLREYSGPATLVAKRIPQRFLEVIYGMKIHTRPIEEGGTGIPTGAEILRAYASARGFSTTGQGQPDESRAARYVLKDYVKGKLLFCHPPPHDPPRDDMEFNRELYDIQHLPPNRRAGLVAQESGSELHDGSSTQDDIIAMPVLEGEKTRSIDKRFFGVGQAHSAHMRMPPHLQDSASRKHLTGRKQRTMLALEKDVDPVDLRTGNGKKHFKGNKRKGKLRSEYV